MPERLPLASEGPTVATVSPFRAPVENGRLILDEPTALLEGTVVDLVADDEGDCLTEDERRVDDETPPCDAIAAKVRGRVASMETTTLHP